MARMDRHKQRPEEQAQYRASYPPDPAAPTIYRTQEDETAYPDQAYFVPKSDFEDDPPALDSYPVTPASVRSAWASGGTPRKPRKTALWVFIAFCCVAVLSLLGFWMASLHEAYAPFRQMVAVTQGDTFAQGVFVDGVNIGGMTRAQAEQALNQNASSQQNALHISLNIDGITWVITDTELPFTRNTAAVLDVAYAVGRIGSPETIGISMTPLEYRYAHLRHVAENPAYLITQVTYDPADVRRLVGIVESNINRDPVDAQVATFDFSTRAFTFTEDHPGARLDGDALYRQIVDALNAGNYQAQITMQSETLLPAVTRVELMNSFALVSTYTTQTTSDANRNTNIDLACRAVSGTVVMPGETFSFNNTTGQRTAEKGYLPAAAIAGGTTVDEIGGGVCQVSSTLFNAAAMADLTIVSRTPHTWPSNYVDKGRDATVNWPNLDFVFRNDKDTPVFIVAYYERRNCTVELYGAGLGAGETIELSTRTVSVTEPPADPIYEQNPELPPGTVQEKKKARTGYEVETYKVYLHNGVEYRRELLCTSVYRMIQQVIEWN